jgi:translation elongation factor EF-Ts
MAAITAGLVKELREKTGAGMMDCKNALTETNGDIEASIDWLRKKGLAKAAKKSGRVAADGLVGVAVEDNVGVVVEVNSETDFVARNDDFQGLVRGILAVALDKAPEVDAETVLGAHYMGGGTVDEAIANAIATIGENITLRRVQSRKARSAITFTARSSRASDASASSSASSRRAITRRSFRSASSSRCMSPPRARSRSTQRVSIRRRWRGSAPCSPRRTPASQPTSSRRSSSPA